MTRIHIILHVDFEGAGHIESWAKEQNAQITYTRQYINQRLPKMDDFDALVVMGGSMGIYDDHEYNWLAREKKFIEQAIAANKKILGICLGAQLVAHCLGAKVVANSQKEIGWFPIKVVEPHPLFKNAIDGDSFITFHWHGDTFELPTNCSHLFKSEACVNQAFIYNNQVIGLQFHTEITLPSMLDMICNCSDELLLNGEYIQNQTLIIQGLEKYEAQNKALLFNLLNGLFGV